MPKKKTVAKGQTVSGRKPKISKVSKVVKAPLAKGQSAPGRKKAEVKATALPQQTKQNLFNQLNLDESYISLLLGILVVCIIVVFAIVIFKPDRKGSVSSTRTDIMTEQKKKDNQGATPSATVIPENPQEVVGEKITGKTYTVQEGDSISSIAQRAYNDEEKWVVIAEANNLFSPDSIAAGMVLKIPR